MALPRNQITVRCEIPHKLGFLLGMHRYKVAYGGRGAGKSASFARALLTLGAHQRLRILCAREVQKSIKDSVHRLLADTIEVMKLGKFYSVLENEIRGKNATVIIFAGLSDMTAESIKSYEGIDICWVEEAQAVSKRSWDILVPTIRAPNSEIWVSFNPSMDTDETYQRFVVRKPDNSVVVAMNWYDNPWFPPVLEQERLACKRDQPADYDNIWEGKPRSVVDGAIYSREVEQLIGEGRYRPTPYDPMRPVHCIWDLGWNDAMTIVMVQRPTPTVVNVINYMEDSQRTYAEFVRDLDALGYRFGTDWLPHDAVNKDPKSGKNVVQVLRALGRRHIKLVGRNNLEEGIRNARMMFPRMYLDNTERQRATGYLGGPRLLECLRRYRRHIPRTTGEASGPLHDQHCLGPDTRIRTLGGWKRIADLVGKDFHVWGYSETEGRIVPAKAVKCWETKTVDEVAKVTLDSGAVITCTPDHRFLLRDGKTYVEAQHLAPKTSLMPLYERRVGKQPQLHLNDGTVAVEHRYAYARLVAPLIEGHHIHHLDEDKTNNEPSNLRQLTAAEHCAIHSNSPEHLEHLRRISNRKGSKRATEKLIAVNKARAGDNHHTRDPDYWTEDRRRKTGEQFSESLKASEREKDCPGCGGVFVGNWKRVYCCNNCKATARRRQKGAPESPWRVTSPHEGTCQLHAPHNHRVVKVEIVKERTTVYDIEVEGIHNFVAEGVVVHNSHGADAFRYLATIVSQINDEQAVPSLPTVPAFQAFDAVSGMLG